MLAIDTVNNRTTNRIGLVIFILLFLSYCYFHQNPWNWNSIPRVALGISLVEDGSVNINKFYRATGDKALYKDNYYSDKAPGMTFTALPAIAATMLYFKSGQKDYSWVNESGSISAPFIFVTQVATIFTSGLLTALAALVLYFVAIRLGAGIVGATFGALAFGLATPAWGWATAFFGHAAAASCLFLGFAAILYLLNSSSTKKKEIALGFAAGALLSWAVVIEYTSAPASAIIAIYGLVSAWRWERDRFIRVLSWSIAGATLFILPLLIYNYVVYEDFFTSGYRYHTTFPGTKEGFYGIESPRLRIVGRLLLGVKRGIFWLSPLLLLVPYALYRQWKIPGHKGLTMTIIAVTLYYLLWNSGYVYWTGGSTTGPRFLTPILPFICLSLAMLWSYAGKYLKIGLIFLFIVSFFISLMSVSVSMMPLGNSKPNIVLEYLLPQFLEATKLKTSLLVRMISQSYQGSSQIHLFPLYIMLVLGFIYILWQLKKYRNKATAESVEYS